MNTKENPVTETIIGKTIAIKIKEGDVSVLKINHLCNNGWFSSVAWLNENEFKYLILPE